MGSTTDVVKPITPAEALERWKHRKERDLSPVFETINEALEESPYGTSVPWKTLPELDIHEKSLIRNAFFNADWDVEAHDSELHFKGRRRTFEGK